MDAELREAVAGAEAYESLHVPALFDEWTPRVLEAARVDRGHRVVDVASGTGVLARAALDRVGPTGQVVGVDPNPGMLTVARRLNDRIEWRAGLAEELPCEDAAFDRVVSQFGMMFFSDRVGAVKEIVRVLAPGGRFALAVWGALESTPAYAVTVDLLHRMAGEEAAYALRAPFVLGDVGALATLVANASRTPVEAWTIEGRARFPSVRTMVEADLRGWLPVMGIELAEDVILAILTAAEQELAEFTLPDGRVEFAMPAHIVSGSVAT